MVEERRGKREREAKYGRVHNFSEDAVSVVDSRSAMTRTHKEGRLRARALSKSGPRELPSNRPVAVGRDVCIGLHRFETDVQRTVKRFDPRFEDHCGELRDMHVERNYAFLAEQREQRRKSLEEVVARTQQHQKRKNGSKKEKSHNSTKAEAVHAERELEAIRQNDLRRNAILRQREVLQQVKEDEKEAVRRGKNPFFLKKKDLRRKELRARFDDLKKQKGGVNKFIAKRRRKLVGKDRKFMGNR